MSSLYRGHVFNEYFNDNFLPHLWKQGRRMTVVKSWSAGMSQPYTLVMYLCNNGWEIFALSMQLHARVVESGLTIASHIPLKLGNRHPFAFSLFMLPWLYHFTANPKLDLLMYLLASPCWILIFLSFINYFGSYFWKRLQCYLGWSCAEFQTLRWSNWITLRFSGKSLVACRSLIYRTTSCLLTLLGPSENLQSWNKSKILTWSNTSTWGYIVKSSSLEFFF